MNKINRFVGSRRPATRGGMLVAVLAALAFMAGASSSPVSAASLQKEQNLNTQVAEILALQATFHQVISHNGDPATRMQHLAAMADLWEDGSTLTAFGVTYVGKDAILAFWSSAAPFNNHWVSLAPTFRTAIGIHGNTADIYFECYFVATAGNIVVQRSLGGTLKKVNGRWLYSAVVIALPATPLF